VMHKDVAAEKGVTPDSPITDRFKALEGLKIGITRPGAPTDLYPRYFLQQAGLDPQKSATFVPIGDAATLVGALKSKRIDGFMLSPPGPYLAEQQGFGTVLIKGKQSLPVFEEYDFTSAAVMDDYAQENPDVVKGYSAAVSEASQWMIDNPEEALTLLHENAFADTDLPTLKLSLDLFLEAVNPSGEVTEKALSNQIEVLSSLGVLNDPSKIQVSELFTDEYSAAAGS
jgi:NitT/TauT family transport system substrate-binding protein